MQKARRNNKKTIPRKLYIMDLDQTLWSGRELYPDTKDILQTLRKNGHLIYLASFNDKVPSILKQLGIYHLFHGGAFTAGASKYGMILEIIQHSGQKNNIEFYDDLPSNIEEVNVRSRGAVRTVLVRDGIKWDLIHQ